LFIGSSTEARKVAAALQAGLDHDAEVTIWYQNTFSPSTGTLESLEDLVENRLELKGVELPVSASFRRS
jgi:predicted nucleotide-binding protein